MDNRSQDKGGRVWDGKVVRRFHQPRTVPVNGYVPSRPPKVLFIMSIDPGKILRSRGS